MKVVFVMIRLSRVSTSPRSPMVMYKGITSMIVVSMYESSVIRANRRKPG